MRPLTSLARLGALVFTASMILGGAACGLVAGLDKLEFKDPAGCGEACDDANPCTQGDCIIEGACLGQPVADGPDPGDPIGDCQTMACASGLAKVTLDDTDTPDDDGNPCTTEVCAEGAPGHPARPDGDPCTKSGVPGACAGGTCLVKCAVDADCDDENPCSIDACDLVTLLCKSTLLDEVPTPGATPSVGDCHTHVCVAGVDTNAPDDTDVPETMNDCIVSACMMGTTALTPKAPGAMCSTGGGQVCDGAGACVECNVDADCAPTGDECKIAICTLNKTCGVAFAPSSTVLSPMSQIMGDCSALHCNGSGAAIGKVDTSDVPDDNSQCTADKCNGSTPSNTPVPAGTDCGVGQKCNAAGLCGCANDLQCIPPGTCGGGNPGVSFTCGCTKQTCAAIGATCGVVTDGCTATQNCNSGTKNGTETDVDCGGGGNCATTCAMGKACGVDGDCASGHCADGVCCNNACVGACVACNAVGTIGTCTNVKVGLPDPLTCVSPSSCDGSGHCKKPIGQACAVNFDCGSGFCADGFCCDSACTGTCLSCKVTNFVGTCTSVPSGQTDSNATTTCVAPNACNGAAACKKTNSQICGAGSECLSGNCVDGVCCNSTCTGACLACNLAGSAGTCSNVPLGSVDPGTCAAPSTCNGAGACKFTSGQACTLDAQCLSGVCTPLSTCQ